jgi:hypothetical protein
MMMTPRRQAMAFFVRGRRIISAVTLGAFVYLLGVVPPLRAQGNRQERAARAEDGPGFLERATDQGAQLKKPNSLWPIILIVAGAGAVAVALLLVLPKAKAKQQYTVRFEAGADGSISGSTEQRVDSGASCTAVTASPNSGCHFVVWTGSGGFNSTTNPLTVTNVISDMTIIANFAPNGGADYDITGDWDFHLSWLSTVIRAQFSGTKQSGTWSYVGYQEKGTYTVTGNKINMIFDGHPDFVMKGQFDNPTNLSGTYKQGSGSEMAWTATRPNN